MLAERTIRGVLQYEIRWKGHSKQYDSWGPLVNLPGSEDLVRDFQKERAEKNAKREAELEEKKRKKREAEQLQLARATTVTTPTKSPSASDENSVAASEENSVSVIENLMKDKYGKFGPYASYGRRLSTAVC